MHFMNGTLATVLAPPNAIEGSPLIESIKDWSFFWKFLVLKYFTLSSGHLNNFPLAFQIYTMSGSVYFFALSYTKKDTLPGVASNS